MPQTLASRSRSPIATRSTLPQLKDLLLHLASERGLADNSLHAYRRDLEDVEKFFTARRKTLLSAKADDYRGYLQDQSRKGQSTKTVARRLAHIHTHTGGYGGVLMLAYDWEGENRGQWQHSMRLLAREVMPRLEELTRLSTASPRLS